MKPRILWAMFIFVMVSAFAVLGYFGYEIYQKVPPIPEKVVDQEGNLLFTKEDIQDGQNVWQSIGGQEVGTIWGHGAYVAPDWSADWLHREALHILNIWSQNKYGMAYEVLPKAEKGLLEGQLKESIRTNSYNPENKTLTLFPERVMAFQALSSYYRDLFMGAPQMATLRASYAMQTNSIKDIELMRKMNAFFFWTTWATVTERPEGGGISYTHNWPPDKLVGNEATPSLILWTGFSVTMLLIGIATLAFYYATHKEEEIGKSAPANDPLLSSQLTPSMKATLKYFWTVILLVVVQIVLGAVTAHYGVEGTGFYGIPIGDILPYSVVRTWHIQLAIFWIATSWLATGLFLAPAVSGVEPKFQRAGVNFLYICLLIIVVGSLFGEWLGIQQYFGLVANFWFGHQGYEYVDLGRFWQIFLFVGLWVWLFLVARALIPAFKKEVESRHLLFMFLIASTAIALFYGAGLMIGQKSHLSVMEYWRWWVVHLWVEGFFEVFATVVVAFLFVRLRLIGIQMATSTVLFSTTIFLSGGIIGTFHHLYFAGTPTSIIALGATFSALEVVPLVLMGFEGYHQYRLAHATHWISTYRWPIYFFVAVAFWNLVGAGIFGFLINPPIALYYMQGLNTTPVHGHTALFGVYGMLGIGLSLFVLRGLSSKEQWEKSPSLSIAFWGLNVGMMLMVLLSVLPVGLLQTWASVENGIWYARSAEFMQTPIMNYFRWARVFGDTIFAIGALALGWFVFRLKVRFSWKELF